MISSMSIRTKQLHINYPSFDADQVGQVSASIREVILDKFRSNQISFSFSSNKESGYIMVYPTQPILQVRVSNHSPIGDAVDNTTIQAEGNRVTVNAEAEHGQQISESVLYDTLEQIKKQCEELQLKLQHE